MKPSRSPALPALAALLACCLACAAPANADPVPVVLGHLDTAGQGLSYSAAGLYGDFRHTLTFELTAALALKGDFAWRNRNATSISGFDATLYTASGSLVASDSTGGPTSSLFNPYLGRLDPGAYALVVSGSGGGNNGGQYTVALTGLAASFAPASTSPVPEPAAWISLAAGLLLLGAYKPRAAVCTS